MTPTDHRDWIELRVQELMLDGHATVEMIETIQQQGGMAHRALCAALRRLLDADTPIAMADAIDAAIAELIPFAYQRAWREFNRLEISHEHP